MKNLNFLTKSLIILTVTAGLAGLVLAQTSGELRATILTPQNDDEFTVGEEIFFAGQGEGGTPPYGYLWDFGDDTGAGGQSYTKTYTQSDDFTVTLTINDSEDNIAETSILIHIRDDGDDDDDTTPPTAPEITFSSHQENATSTVTVVEMRWSQSTDEDSGLAGYSFAWDHEPEITPDKVVDTSETQASQTLGDGIWYFHLIAVDNAGNISTPTTHYGPIIIETDSDGGAPIISNLRATDITSNSVVIRWETDRPATSRVIYDTESHDLSDGPPPNYGYRFSTQTFDTNPKVTEHAVQISGLTPSTTYYFRAVSA